MNNLWCALWRSECKLDGKSEHIIRVNLVPVIFKTKRQCKAWIDEHYRYIKIRKDLRGEPHGWRLPKPVKIVVRILEAEHE